jgi:hypothetical protein
VGFSNTLRNAFNSFASKGPIDSVWARRRFAISAERVAPWLTDDETRQLVAARRWALEGRGRDRWDAICSEVRARLFQR